MATISPADDLVWSLNLVNGVVDQVQRHIFEHPVLAKNQVEVEPFTESFADWQPKTKAEYLSWKDDAARPENRAKHVGEITDQNITTGSSVDEMNEKTPIEPEAPSAP